MKKIITVLSGLLVASSAYADACSAGLTGVFPAGQAVKLCSTFGDAMNQSLIPVASNTYDLGTSSLRWKDIYSSGTITSSIATSIGWSVVAGANTACNTTCTNGCVVGQDTGTANVFVACDSATADVCLCAGAS